MLNDVPAVYEVRVMPQANESKADIEDYLAGFSHASDIEKVAALIEEAIDGLTERPTRHRLLRQAVSPRFIRCAPAGKYVIFFDVDEAAQTVSVLDVQHRRRSDAFLCGRLA